MVDTGTRRWKDLTVYNSRCYLCNMEMLKFKHSVKVCEKCYSCYSLNPTSYAFYPARADMYVSLGNSAKGIR